MMAFFSSEAKQTPMAPDDGIVHLYPSSTSQFPQSIMYSPPLHHMAHRSSTTMLGYPAMYTPPQDYRPIMDSPYPPHALWSTQPSSIPLPQATSYVYPSFFGVAPPPMLVHDSTLLSQSFGAPQPSRPHSTPSSTGHGIPSNGPSERSPHSPSSLDLQSYGITNKNGTWSCALPGCTSKTVFIRACDLRKHYKQHTKSFFCQHGDCPQSKGGGFSRKEDLARHKAKHNPDVLCHWDGCDRVFSRVDNMVNMDSLPWENVLR